jgi:SAM-dependent methyltransferase
VVERTAEQIRAHYELERQLAARLRTATRDERRMLYGEVYDELNRRIPDHPLATAARENSTGALPDQARLLRHLVKRDTVFLEIGPGDCRVSMAVAKWVSHAYAVDVSLALMSGTQKPPNLELILFDGITVPLPPGTVSVAYSNDVIEHLHPEDALAQLSSILATLVPGGEYLCVTPNRLSGPHDISRHFDKEATGFHLREYTLAELHQELRQAGFSRVQAILSYHGAVFAPRLPARPMLLLERLIAALPYGLRRKTAAVLTAVKLVGIK